MVFDGFLTNFKASKGSESLGGLLLAVAGRGGALFGGATALPAHAGRHEPAVPLGPGAGSCALLDRHAGGAPGRGGDEALLGHFGGEIW